MKKSIIDMADHDLALVAVIGFIFNSFSEAPKKPSKRYRKWDGKTPMAVHPTWCAMTILTEKGLPEELRWRGAHALLLHDTLEDTTSALPADTPDDVQQLVGEMTFEGGSAEEYELLWERSDEAKLLKLYDKTSNLLDIFDMSDVKRRNMIGHTERLVELVAEIYGELNIVAIAKAVLSERKS